MNKHLKIPVLIIILLIHSLGPIYSQTEQYKFRHLTTKQGLPSNKVNSLIKDHADFMWFATDNGLARYDGYNFKRYQIPGDSVLTPNDQVVNTIFEDRDGILWVGTYDQGIRKFYRNNETFSSYKHKPDDPNSLSNNYVNEIYQDRRGVLWIGTNNGLNIYNVDSNNFKSYKQDEGNINNPKDKVLTIFEDRTGIFWIGTADGLFVFDRIKKSFTKFDLGKVIPGRQYHSINCIIEDKNGIIWIGTDWGMFKCDVKNKKTTNYLPISLMQPPPGMPEPTTFLSTIFVHSIIEAEAIDKHILWIATGWGLNRFDTENENFEVIKGNQSDPQSLSTNTLEKLFLDHTGLLWIGTYTSGVEVLNTRINPFHQVMLKLPDQNYHFQANCYLWDTTETLWVGAMDEGLFQYDKDFNLIGNYSRWRLGVNTFGERQHNLINCIYEDSDNMLWLGFYEWGLIIFDREQKTFKQIELHNNSNDPKPKRIDNIIEDHYGILWIGTFSGLYIKNKNERIDSPAYIIGHDELSKAEIINIFEDKKQNLWISTRNSGLYCLKPENRSSMQFVRYIDDQHKQNGFLGNFITTVYEDPKGTLWVGTNQGLNKFNFLKEQFEPDTMFNEDHTGYIIGMYSDDHYNLWLLNTTDGLVRYRPYTDKKNKVKVFDVSDGLPFDNFNTLYYPANVFYQSYDGRLFLSAGIGTGGSFFWFHPDSITENNHIPHTVITNFNVENNTFSLDTSITDKKHITLKYNENFFSFEFAALDFLVPEKNQYAYWLEGFEDEWIYSGNRRLANYTDVPPGEYTFRVKGSNNDGYWNEVGVAVRVSILPPPWRTWWAYVIYGLMLGFIVYGLRMYDLKRQRLKQKLEIEHVEAEKLKELDSMKSHFFANISHEFRTPLTLILGPLQKLFLKLSDDETKQELNIMQRNARRLQNLINQLLDLSKLESGKMKLQAEERDAILLITGIVQSFESLAKQKGIELVFTSERDAIPFWIDREKLEQVLNNLISNAFKFTSGGGTD